MLPQSIKDVKQQLIDILYSKEINIYVKELCHLIFNYCLSIDSFVFVIVDQKHIFQLTNNNTTINLQSKMPISLHPPSRTQNNNYIQFKLETPLIITYPSHHHKIQLVCYYFNIKIEGLKKTNEGNYYIIRNNTNFSDNENVIYDVDDNYEISLTNIYICKSFLTDEFLFLI